MNNSTLISLQKIGKVFLTDTLETHALSQISLEIMAGDYLAIQGPSGCGKSTLLSILGLLDRPTSGKYLLSGNDTADLKPKERARVRNTSFGFVFQSFNLIDDLSVYENVELPLTYRLDLPKQKRRNKVVTALERVNMTHRLRHYPSQLSGGQQQRVAVARAIGGDPAILLADEPTGNLDSENGAHIMTLFDDLSKAGTTICMVTHDVDFAARASRQCDLLDGKTVTSAQL